MNTKKVIQKNDQGSDWAIVFAEQLWAQLYALKYNQPEILLDSKTWKNLFCQAKEAAIEFGAKTLVARLRKEYEPEVFRKILSEIGLKKISERIEYRADISLLPDDLGSLLQWKMVKELGWDVAKMAHYTSAITKDAFDIDPNEKSEDFIQDWLCNADLTYGLDCISIGFLNDVPCALVVAQVNKLSGWSRLSYMGLIPEFRGKGLGKWVQRQGFKMMKAQGGKTYHGGTHSDNKAMRKLFESHGCKIFAEMEEWSCEV